MFHGVFLQLHSWLHKCYISPMLAQPTSSELKFISLYAENVVSWIPSQALFLLEVRWFSFSTHTPSGDFCAKLSQYRQQGPGFPALIQNVSQEPCRFQHFLMVSTTITTCSLSFVRFCLSLPYRFCSWNDSPGNIWDINCHLSCGMVKCKERAASLCKSMRF